MYSQTKVVLCYLSLRQRVVKVLVAERSKRIGLELLNHCVVYAALLVTSGVLAEVPEKGVLTA